MQTLVVIVTKRPDKQILIPIGVLPNLILYLTSLTDLNWCFIQQPIIGTVNKARVKKVGNSNFGSSNPHQ